MFLHTEDACSGPDQPSTVMFCHHRTSQEMLHRKMQKSPGQAIIIITCPTRKLNYLRLGGCLVEGWRAGRAPLPLPDPAHLATHAAALGTDTGKHAPAHAPTRCHPFSEGRAEDCTAGRELRGALITPAPRASQVGAPTPPTPILGLNWHRQAHKDPLQYILRAGGGRQ